MTSIRNSEFEDMARKRHTESQIREIFAEQTDGVSVADIVKKHKISSATFYNWKTKYARASASVPKRGRPAGNTSALQPFHATSSASNENSRLKIMVVDLMLQIDHLKSQLERR